MSRVEQSIAVHCPLTIGPTHLGNWFRAHALPDGETASIELEVAAPIIGLTKAMSVHRSAIATLRSVPPPTSGEARYRVHWGPKIAGPFPLFTGELVLEAVSTRDSLSLRLHGNYAPPPAFLGHDVIGNRLAVATAHQLLLGIRDFVERDLRVERARDRSKRTTPSYEVSATLE